jgi:hypothetical protein
VQLPVRAGVALVEAWVNEHRDSPERPRARLWQGQVLLSSGDLPAARVALSEAAALARGTDLELDARLALADLLSLEGHDEDALHAWETLGAPAGSRWELQAQLRSDKVRGDLLRLRVLWLLGPTLLLFWGLRAWRVRAHGLPAPPEVAWVAPVLVLLAASGALRPPGERGAVLGVSLGGLVLLWLHGAASRVAKRPWLTGLSGLVQLAALFYCAVVGAGLWDRVMDTLASGSE